MSPRVVWPPNDPVVAVLEGLIDRSPHGDWLTSSQSLAAAERIVGALARHGYVIQKGPLPADHEHDWLSGQHAYQCICGEWEPIESRGFRETVL